MKHKCFAEAFGTFCLVFAGTGAIIVNDVSGGAVTHPGIAMTFGLVVMAMIFSIGAVSGAHINPAVTIAFWISGRFKAGAVLPYCLSQIGGALAASLLLRVMFVDHAALGATVPAGPAMQSFVFEVVLTMILMFVILCVATGPKEIGIMAAIAIGGTVGLEAMFAGPISGASMNPARSLAPAVVSGELASVWIYLLAPTIGAALAVPCCRAIREAPVSTPVSTTLSKESVTHE